VLTVVRSLICEIGSQKRCITLPIKQNRASKEIERKTSKMARRGWERRMKGVERRGRRRDRALAPSSNGVLDLTLIFFG
jgi:hypothetical protein